MPKAYNPVLLMLRFASSSPTSDYSRLERGRALSNTTDDALSKAGLPQPLVSAHAVFDLETIPWRKFHGHQFRSCRIDARARMVRSTTARSAQQHHHHPSRARQRRQLLLAEQEQFAPSSTRTGFTPGLRTVEEVRCLRPTNGT
jgi:hypothetical protein